MFICAISFGAMFFGSLLFMVELQYSILKAGRDRTWSSTRSNPCGPFRQLALRVGQRPLILIGGLLLTVSAFYWLVALSFEPNYWVGFVPPFTIVAISIALIFPQVTSIAADPPSGSEWRRQRSHTGSAAVRSDIWSSAYFGVRWQHFLRSPRVVYHFDQIWWTLAILGVLTTLCNLPMVITKNLRAHWKLNVPMQAMPYRCSYEKCEVPLPSLSRNQFDHFAAMRSSPSTRRSWYWAWPGLAKFAS